MVPDLFVLSIPPLVGFAHLCVFMDAVDTHAGKTITVASKLNNLTDCILQCLVVAKPNESFCAPCEYSCTTAFHNT